jgi:hypothetical protein
VTNAGVDRQVYETIRELDELYLRLRKPEPNVPPRLFHYTDPHGLLGIILSRGLWASNADYLNDSSEPAHALGVLRVAFQQVAGSLRPGSFAERALDGCWDWALNMHKAEGPHVYVFCMSEHDDLLSQWRSYGAHGAGYALGFSGRTLSELLQASEGQYLLKTVYGRSEQSLDAEEVFKEIISVAERAETTFGPINRATVGDAAVSRLYLQLRTSVLSEIIRLRAKFKAPAFQEEREWRIVQFVHPRVEKPEVRFRLGLGVIRPYIDLNFGENNLPIEQVSIGPTLKPDLSQQSLGLLLVKCGHPNVEVKISAVPFRR